MIDKNYLKSREWALIFESPKFSKSYNNVEYCNADFNEVLNLIVISSPVYSNKIGKEYLPINQTEGVTFISINEIDKGFLIDSEKYGTIRMVEYSM